MIPTMRVVESLDGATITAHCGECVFCGKSAVVRGIPAHDFSRWYNGGEPVQVALSALSDDDREILATGTHGQCFTDACEEVAPLMPEEPSK